MNFNIYRLENWTSPGSGLVLTLIVPNTITPPNVALDRKIRRFFLAGPICRFWSPAISISTRIDAPCRTSLLHHDL